MTKSEAVACLATGTFLFSMTWAAGTAAGTDPPSPTDQMQQQGIPEVQTSEPAAVPAAPEGKPEQAKSPELQRSEAAGQVLTAVLKGEARIPEHLLEQAEGVAVFPQMNRTESETEGVGQGMMSRRNADGTWSPPVYLEITGEAKGLDPESGAAVVLVFTSSEVLEALVKEEVDLGDDLLARPGVLGTEKVKTEPGPAVYGYTRTDEYLIGISPAGLLLAADEATNQATYGRGSTTAKLLKGEGITIPPAAMPFWQALGKHMPQMES